MDENILVTLADNLRAYRAIARLSREEVAKRTGLSVGAIQVWENGESAMSVNALCTIADLYGVSTDKLLGRAAE